MRTLRERVAIPRWVLLLLVVTLVYNAAAAGDWLVVVAAIAGSLAGLIASFVRREGNGSHA